MYFFPEKPKLININQPLFQKLQDDPDWVAEPKYNGSRLILIVNGEDVEFWNRHGEQFDYRPDEDLRKTLIEFAERTRGICLFDGELRHNRVQNVKHHIALWDTFMWDGKLLANMPYMERQNYIPQPKFVKDKMAPISQHMGDFRELFHEWTKDPEIEGMVIKNLKGKLNLSRTAGQSSNWMFKVRRANNSYRF
jgi:ATP-dependent DNA ligase